MPQEAWDASAFVGYSQAHGLTANGLLGVVAFANTATVTNLTAGERLFDSFAPAIGGGLRVLFNKRSRTNFCIDSGGTARPARRVCIRDSGCVLSGP